MNWKLIFTLSLFGLVMGIGTVYFIPSNIEPFCWLTIFVICAYAIAKNAPSKYFLHGFCVSLVNCIWITGAHILLYRTYIANHHAEMMAMRTMPMVTHTRTLMAIMGGFIGVISGLILGLFSFIASKLVKKNRVPVLNTV